MSVNLYDANNKILIPISGTNSHLTDDMVASYEESSVSAHTYNIGEQFIHDGLLYTATDSIAIGDTFEIGTNCEISESLTAQILQQNNLVKELGLSVVNGAICVTYSVTT